MGYIIIGIILLVTLIIWLININSKNIYEHEQYEREQREIKNAGNFGEAICKSEIKQILRNDDILINNICLNINGKKLKLII